MLRRPTILNRPCTLFPVTTLFRSPLPGAPGRKTRTGSVPGIRRRQTFDPAPSSARSARRFVAGVLQEAGFSGDVDTVLLLVSEVVTNAVRHAGSELTVLVELVDDEVTVTVADESDDVAMVTEPTTDATTGRGMVIKFG